MGLSVAVSLTVAFMDLALSTFVADPIRRGFEGRRGRIRVVRRRGALIWGMALPSNIKLIKTGSLSLLLPLPPRPQEVYNAHKQHIPPASSGSCIPQ